MKTQNELTKIVAKNITYFRRKNGLTQLELAEKISYSDKAISKWERGDALPDVFVLSQLSEVFHITVNDFLVEHAEEFFEKEEMANKERTTLNKFVVAILSCGLIWLIAMVIYVIIELIMPRSTLSWLTFIYAIPLSLIVALVFCGLWGYRWMRYVCVSLLAWSIGLTFYISFDEMTHIDNLYLIFAIVSMFQLLIIFWFFRKKRVR